MEKGDFKLILIAAFTDVDRLYNELYKDAEKDIPEIRSIKQEVLIAKKTAIKTMYDKATQLIDNL